MIYRMYQINFDYYDYLGNSNKVQQMLDIYCVSATLYVILFNFAHISMLNDIIVFSLKLLHNFLKSHKTCKNKLQD